MLCYRSVEQDQVSGTGMAWMDVDACRNDADAGCGNEKTVTFAAVHHFLYHR